MALLSLAGLTYRPVDPAVGGPSTGALNTMGCFWYAATGVKVVGLFEPRPRPFGVPTFTLYIRYPILGLSKVIIVKYLNYFDFGHLPKEFVDFM